MRMQTVTRSKETNDALRALRRAARRALELGIRTGTPVYVLQDNQIVDLTRQSRRPKKSKLSSGRSKAKPRSRRAA